MTKVTSDIMTNMITYFNGDVRRVNHALKVYAFARNIAMSEGVSQNSNNKFIKVYTRIG